MTTLQKIQAAKTISELRDLLYRAETAEEHAAICLREAELIAEEQRQ